VDREAAPVKSALSGPKHAPRSLNARRWWWWWGEGGFKTASVAEAAEEAEAERRRHATTRNALVVRAVRLHASSACAQRATVRAAARYKPIAELIDQLNR
jgi:hypothetical protein